MSNGTGFVHGKKNRRPESRRPTKDSRRPYAAPKLVEWGSIHKLTRGGDSGTVDGDFTGTGGI